MAVTLREGRSVRGQEIIVQRPDGSRATILPHPQPLRNAHGEMVGALNMLVDISDRKRAEEIQMLLATIVESSEDAIMSLTLDGRILTWNAGAEQLFGYSAGEAIGQPITIIVPPDRWGEEKEILARLQRGERIKHYDTVRVSKSGRHIDISLSLSPIRDCTGRITAASKVARDITERRQAEQERLRLLAAEHQARAEVERSRRSYQDLVNGLDAIVWEADAQTWKFHFVSQRAEQILGYPVRRWLEEPDFWTQVIHPDDRDWAVRLCKAACQQCADHDFEYRAVAADGRVLWLRDIVYVVTNQAGMADRLRGVMFDVTRTKQLEADLQKRAEELSESDRRKDEFLAMLGHELRNPLAPIRTGLDILTASGIDHEAITIMRSQVDCLVRLVDDLLDVSRITRGKIRLQKKDVDLASIARRAVEATAALAAERRHDVRVSAPSGVWVCGDAVRLAQVVTNLLNNAMKYTPAGGRIDVTVARDSGHASLSVRDNGIGIDPDGLARIFEPFIQCERARESFQGGLGIGLTLVRSLIELHGGTVSARSDGLGRGSEFVLRLPVLARQAELQRQEEPVICPTHHRRILVVDDNLSAARTLEMLITRLGEYDLHVVHDGPAALEALQRLSPDVALIDVDLPGMDGHEVVRRFQASGHSSGILLVALTGFGTPDDRQRSLQAGFAQHLVKPVSLRDLRKVLGQLPTPSREVGGNRLAASAADLEWPETSPDSR
jgi:PAS domain S-box-containing protein